MPNSCRRSRSARRSTRTGPAPSPPTMRLPARAASCAAQPSRGPTPATGSAPARATSSARRRRRPAIHRHRRHIHRPSSPPTISRIRRAQTLQEIIAQVPGVQLTVLFGGVNGAKTIVDLRGFGAFATANTLFLHQRPPAQRHRHGPGRSLDHPARFDRAHRDHPRQQRRGALRRQCGRRRHQHRHQDRRRRPAGRDPGRGRLTARSTSAWPSVSAAANSGPWSTSFYGNGIKSDGYRVNNALDQRNGVGNLNYTTPDLKAFLTVTGDDQKLGFPGGRHRRSRRSASTNSSPTAGAPARRSTTATSRAPAPPPASPRRL